ncbi:MAG: FAD-dependent oxidoreductase [Lachnospiraceae bacterium]|nr:FAD-dependent oxidoreductase [Lachnospiraceae bacterium]
MLDLIIIGSGPAGLSAAIYGIRANLNLLVIEKDYAGTGQIALSSKVDNYLGLPGLDGYSMGEQFRQHAVDFGVNFLEATVTEISQDANDKHWIVKTADGAVNEAKAIIYAAGAVHRHLGVPGENEFAAKGVSYCATCDGAFYRGKVTAVVGGGDTALDDALYLSALCEKVYLIHRRDAFRAAEITVDRVRSKENIELVLNSQVEEILGSDRVNSVRLVGGRVLDIDGIFVAAGSVPVSRVVPECVEKNEAGYIVADETGVTSAPGFFAAGDVRTKALRQVVTAVSDGANTATAAAHYIENF